MNRTAIAATAIVALNLAIATAHGRSHAEAHVPLEPWQHTFVLAAVCAVPVLAAVLYWTPLRKLAAALLGSSMLAATVFGVYFHFVADTVDHVSHRSHDDAGTVFTVTAALLVPAGLVGTAFAAWSWSRPRQG